MPRFVHVDGVTREATAEEEAEIDAREAKEAARPPFDPVDELSLVELFFLEEIAAANGETVDDVKARYRTFLAGR